VLPAPDLIARAGALLAPARRPLLLVGDGVSVSGGDPELTRVAEKLGADVWFVDSSEAHMPTGHPLVRGPIGHMFGEVSRAAVADADAVLIVGTYVFPEVFPDLAGPFRSDAVVVHVDLDDYEIAKNHPVTLGLVADPKLTLAALADTLDRLRTPEQDAEARARIERRRTEVGDDEPDETVIGAFLSELAAQAPADLMIFDEALTASPHVVRHLRPRLPGHYHLTRGGSLGVGIPGAVGIKLAHPDKTVVGFAGDGGSMYTYQALWTAARYDVAANFVVCNNHRYELLNKNIDQYWSERDIPRHNHPRSFDLSHPEIDFVGLAKSFGADGVRVHKPDQAAEAVARMLSTRRPFLVDLLTDDTRDS
jgi:benzoylformate decarboxylase